MGYEPTQYTPTPRPVEPPPPPPAPPSGPLARFKRAIGPVGIALLIGLKWIAKLKFLAVIFKLKFLGTFLSMIASVGLYTIAFGWRFAVLFVGLLFVHELGHFLWLKKEGIPTGPIVFLPGLGALITMKEHPRNAYIEAKVGLAGPALGSLAAGAVALAGWQLDSNLLLAAAYVGFLLNLFNLIPVTPLDGGRAAAAIHPTLWIAGLIGLAVVTVLWFNFLLVLILILAVVDLRRRTHGVGINDRAYYGIPLRQRVGVAVVYLGLAGLLGVGMALTHVST